MLHLCHQSCGVAVAMQTLQQEMSVLFELLRLLKYVPTKVLSPLTEALIEKSAAPFSSGSDDSVNASKVTVEKSTTLL